MSMTESGSILAVPLFTVPSSRQQRQCFWCTNCKHQSVKLKEPKLTSNLNKFNLLVLGLGVHWIGFLFQLSCGLEVLVAKLRFEVNHHPIADVMPVLLKSGQCASQEEAVEEMKDCRSTVHPCRQSTGMPKYGLSIFYDRLKPKRKQKLPEYP
ncbi:hypothetical protein F2Q70_00017785 [Brassica cretica]|uniref:Uncharacterized protein n=1 Tax=Brassica cretica TaxID=69181 RepID=A0A8S9HXM8_BRACR|nr:hypothetical protein F2Q70_00017785 [Brassica cretica]